MKGSAQKRLLLGNQCKEQRCAVQAKNPDPAGPAWPSGLSCGFSCSLRKVPGSIPGAAISVRTAASVLGLVAGSRLRQTCSVCRSRRFYDLGAEFGTLQAPFRMRFDDLGVEFGTLQAPFRMHSRFRMSDLGVGFGTSRTHPGWVRDTFTVQNVRFRGRIRHVFVGLRARKSVIIIVNMVRECCFFVIFQDRHFKLDCKMTSFCRVYSA